MTKSAARVAEIAETGITRWLALGAVTGPILFALSWLVLGFLSPGYTLWATRIAPYSAISQPVSGLGLGPTGSFMNAAFVFCGFLLFLGVVGIFGEIHDMNPIARLSSRFPQAAASTAGELPGRDRRAMHNGGDLFEGHSEHVVESEGYTLGRSQRFKQDE